MSNHNSKTFLSKKKYFLMFLFICLVFFVSLFSGPVVDDEKQIQLNTRNIYLPYGFGFSVGSDSGNYLRVANDPKIIFENERFVDGRELVPGRVSLSRPGSLFAVFLISKPIEFIWNKLNFFSESIHLELQKSLNYGYEISGIDQKIEDSIDNLSELYPTYISFLILNLLVIFFSFSFYCKSIGISVFKIDSYSKLVLWLGLFFIINDISKKYFVSPNPGIFNLFAASLTLFACSRLDKIRNNNKTLLLFSGVIGFFNLFYEMFICPYLTFLIIFFKIEIFDKKRSPLNLLNDWGVYLTAFLLFIFSYVVWFAMVKFYFGINFYHYGVEAYPGFSALNLDILDTIYTIFHRSFNGLKIALFSTLPILLIFLILFIKNTFFTEEKINLFKNNYFFIGIFYLAFVTIFFSSYGEIRSRHTIACILIFLPFVSLLVEEFEKKYKKKIVIPIIFVMFSIYSVFVARKVFPYGEGIITNPFN